MQWRILAVPSLDGPHLALGDVNGHGAFAVALTNMGESIEVTATARAVGPTDDLPLVVTLSELDAQGTPLAIADFEVTLKLAARGISTLGVFVFARGEAVALDDAHRIELDLLADGVVQGGTSVAVTTAA